jgi:type II secretion system protein I
MRKRQSLTSIQRKGFTLLEVLLSAAILAASLAALGQLISNGTAAGIRSQRQTEAALRCQSKLDEMLAGVEALRTVPETPFADDSRWLWNAEVQATSESLRRVTVSVRNADSTSVDFTLTRLLRVPRVGRAA